MSGNLQSRRRTVGVAYLRIPEFLNAKACRRVAPIAVAYAIGLASWADPADLAAGVHYGASASVVPVNWLSASHARDKAKKQKADAAKQKDETRSKVCWGRRRVAARWKLAFIC